MTLIDRILRLAELWAAAKGHRTTSRLSTIVANDGGLLKRLGDGGNSTVATVDKFAVFLRDFSNWPDGCPSDEARELIHQIGHIATLPETADARREPALSVPEEPPLPFRGRTSGEADACSTGESPAAAADRDAA